MNDIIKPDHIVGARREGQWRPGCRALQVTKMSRAEYDRRTSRRAEPTDRFRLYQRYARADEVLVPEARIGYVEHVYQIGLSERRILVQLDKAFPESCRLVMCFPGAQLYDERKFWVVPFVDGEWWHAGMPAGKWDEAGVESEVSYGYGRNIELKLGDDVPALEGRTHKGRLLGRQ